MYAVIRVGGKQERVEPGKVLEVEYMHEDPGSMVEFRPLVVFDDDGKAHVGKELTRARVLARLLGEKKGEKIKVFKYRPKSGYRRTQGHRQLLTLLEVEEVALGDRVSRKPEVAEAEAPAEAEAATEAEAPAEEAPARKPAAKKPAAKRAGAAKAAAGKAPAAKKAGSRKPAAKKAGATEAPAAKAGGARKAAPGKPAARRAGPKRPPGDESGGTAS